LKSLEEYISSRDKIDIVERNIQVALEACLDIGKIIIANKDLKEPADNKGIFSALAEADIITKKSLLNSPNVNSRKPIIQRSKP
jgi:uncharacterized protein YutE (UPF0331/DUF86 family)